MSAAPRARVLVVDDEPALRRSLARALLRSFDVLTAEDGSSALGLLATTRIDAVLLDLGMTVVTPAAGAAPAPAAPPLRRSEPPATGAPAMAGPSLRRSEPPPALGGVEVLSRIRAEHPEVEVVVMAEPEHAEPALAASRGGAFGLVVKQADLDAAAMLAVERAVERRRLLTRVRALERREGDLSPDPDLLGASPRVQEVVRKAFGIAGSSVPVLITGERGVGKELLARAIHRRSPRADRPLVALSVGALPASEVEDALFGTGEVSGAPGVSGALAAAGEGTLLLAEIEALPLPAQVRLLQALERGEVGGHDGAGAAVAAAHRRLAARLIVTSAADLRERVAQGALRQDLAYRLGVVSLHVPSLRKRREDIPLLAHHFLRRYGRREGREVRRISAEAMRYLREHPWPGNVQELEHAIEYATLMARGEVVTPGDLPPTIAGPDRKHGAVTAADLWELSYVEARERSIDAFEQEYVATLLERCGGNVSEAARQAGMDRANFRRLKKRVERRVDGQAAGEGLSQDAGAEAGVRGAGKDG
ncbi:sigma-54-dependent transcriptional regulator [Chondromyces apiculatus]|uniref:Sigma-54-dependent Fis family transcriptional regulator n=1 Tax=Chondromyces apiculatus DSM 436 TaxID=1192034 RepID=A0A017T6C5_9BACT|nr:sigma-54 dependent transcriptional regulator [Chondromyces apiculatus]EYF04350.1 Hypothetical protein CAP_4614 [Chondromyces apiculatus DSM 436]